ncbi:hypothetical protein [Nostoc sp.]|uniref:hypothetical protein n=1 Tax=Nostoc sp. TaxID=1180 RepID=UPI002FF526C2
MIYQDILQEGLEQGIEQKAQEIAVNMLNQGVAIALIVRVTGLTIQLQQLQAKTDDNQAQ